MIEKGFVLRPPSLEALLAAKRMKDLRALAARHDVDLSNARKKQDIAAALVSSPAAQAIYDELRSELEPTPFGPAPGDAEADRLLQGSKDADVDFGRAEDLLEQARMRFEERNFERAIAAAREAGAYARSSADGVQRTSWAYIILSCQWLIEDCGRAGRDVDDATRLLREVKEAFRTNALTTAPGLLARLEVVTRTLYGREIERARNEIYRVQEAISRVADTGAEVGAADDALNRARDALRRNDPFLASERVVEAAQIAKRIFDRRIHEIEASIPATATMITEARNVGADVFEAERWLEKARLAVTDRQFVLAAELVKRAERSAMQSQHLQIEKAMELRRRQVEKAQQIVEDVEPLIEEAEAFDLDVGEARTLLRQARDVLAKGDYVNGTVFAKNAADVVRRLEPKLIEERERRGIKKPVSGTCRVCGSDRLTFKDDGWGTCTNCGRRFRWRVPASLWDRFLTAIRD